MANISRAQLGDKNALDLDIQDSLIFQKNS